MQAVLTFRVSIEGALQNSEERWKSLLVVFFYISFEIWMVRIVD